MLQSADRLVVWDYFGLPAGPLSTQPTWPGSLKSLGADRLILSAGLWPKEGAPVSPEALRIALLAGLAEGIANQWVTPSRFMTPEHWQVLSDIWTGQGT